MSLHDVFLKPYENYSYFQITLELIATVFGILSVYLSAKKNILGYPIGIISTMIYVYILFHFGLIGDGIINVYYTIMNFYGWILWSKNTDDHIHVEVDWASKKDWIWSGVLFIFSSLIVGFIYYYKPAIDNHFNSEGVELGFYHMDWANGLDILTTSIFLIGMWLMAKRKIENWIFWIIGDLICIPMMMYKGLVITSLQYFVFTFISIKGFQEWKKMNVQ